jgi:hypothetical protein
MADSPRHDPDSEILSGNGFMQFTVALRITHAGIVPGHRQSGGLRWWRHATSLSQPRRNARRPGFRSPQADATVQRFLSLYFTEYLRASIQEENDFLNVSIDCCC